MAGKPILVPGMHFVDGLCLSKFQSADHIKVIKTLDLDPSDVFITGYPRSGNTWTMTTVDAILHAEDLDEFEKKGTKMLNLDYQPYLDDIINAESPRIIWSHLRYNMLPEDIEKKNIKIIHTSRDPRDVAVSYFHLCCTFKPISYEGSWDEFLEDFMEGKILFGSWFDHTKDFLFYKDKPNVLSIEYEEFLEDIPGTITKIAAFLGKALSPAQIAHIASIVEFKSMQKNPKFNKMDLSIFDASKTPFLRSGKSGDWKNYFSNDQEKTFNSIYKPFAEEHGITCRI